MQSLPREFLTELAARYDLSPDQTETLVAYFASPSNEQDVADTLAISVSALRSRMSEVYRKFSISGKGPGKLRKLHDFLMNEYRKTNPALPAVTDSKDIDDQLVQDLRAAIQPLIQERCGTMRVLDMTQPVGLDAIYTNVNILERPTNRSYRELADLMQTADPEQFDRFCLGKVREKRVPGVEAVKTFSKLMILGKPGAGKTTFLKHLAMQCIGGKFQADRVPMFITLKDFAEAEGHPDLLRYCDRLFVSHNPTKTQLIASLPNVLHQGRALILLDGLDEVRDADHSRVIRQIREFTEHFSTNQFVITCRIAAREYTFQQFTDVEIADFDDTQIADFSSKWFRSKNAPTKVEHFLQKLKNDAPIRELATSPLLLTLLCLVFEDSESFPRNRADLYEIGLQKLLSEWDEQRGIKRDQVYKQLSVECKKDLLNHIAYTTFEIGNYFFKQREVERLITQYLQSLPRISIDMEILKLNTTAVLKSIEAQHGLLIERTKGIYSFSHLTFQEYFTVRKIMTSCNPYADSTPLLQELVSHITEKRWREVFLLTAEMLKNADSLLWSMKTQIDGILAGDEKLQEFLTWIDEKAKSVEAPFKPSAVRSFYINTGLDEGALIHGGLAANIDSTYRQIVFDFKNRDHLSRLAIDILLDSNLSEALINSFCFTSFARSFDRALSLNLDKKLQESLRPIVRDLKDKLPEPDILFRDDQVCRDFTKIEQWWQTSSYFWIEHLRAVVIEHRNIGQDWQFSDEQKQLLQQYYDANKLLMDCLNSDCSVSPEVRQEIEETLLLPIEEIEKRKKEKGEG